MRFNIDLYANNLMLPEDEMIKNGVSAQVIQRMLRLRDVYNYMLRNPLKKDREYIDYIQAAYKDEDGKPLSKRKAYEDIEILHAVIGNLQQCSKEWHRWRFNSMIEEGYQLALRRQDAAAIAKLAGMYGKYNKLDKEDELDRGFNEMPHLHFTFDVSTMGFKTLEHLTKVIEDMDSHYSHSSRLQEIAEDADVIELCDAVTQKEKQIEQQLKEKENADA